MTAARQFEVALVSLPEKGIKLSPALLKKMFLTPLELPPVPKITIPGRQQKPFYSHDYKHKFYFVSSNLMFAFIGAYGAHKLSSVSDSDASHSASAAVVSSSGAASVAASCSRTCKL